jgi:hypothetical protein
MSFEQQIQQWVTLDNQLKLLGDKIKELRDKKHTLTEQITSHMETNESDHVRLNDEQQLKLVKVKNTQQLTFKHLETCLSEIIKNEDQVAKIVEYVKNKREITFVPEIKRLFSK